MAIAPKDGLLGIKPESFVQRARRISRNDATTRNLLTAYLALARAGSGHTHAVGLEMRRAIVRAESHPE